MACCGGPPKKAPPPPVPKQIIKPPPPPQPKSPVALPNPQDDFKALEEEEERMLAKRVEELERKHQNQSNIVSEIERKVDDLNGRTREALLKVTARLDHLEDAASSNAAKLQTQNPEEDNQRIEDLAGRIREMMHKMSLMESARATQKKNIDKELQRIRRFMDECVRQGLIQVEGERGPTGPHPTQLQTQNTQQQSQYGMRTQVSQHTQHTHAGGSDTGVPTYRNSGPAQSVSPAQTQQETVQYRKQLDNLEMERQLLLRQLHQTHHLFHQRDDLRKDLLTFRGEVNRLLTTISTDEGRQSQTQRDDY